MTLSSQLNEYKENIINNMELVDDGKLYVTDDMWTEAVKDVVKADPFDGERYTDELETLAEMLETMVINDPRVEVDGEYLTVGE